MGKRKSRPPPIIVPGYPVLSYRPAAPPATPFEDLDIILTSSGRELRHECYLQRSQQIPHAASATLAIPSSTVSITPAKRPSGSRAHPFDSTAGSNWSPDEDARMIGLRNNGMNWKQISEQFPGRTEASYRSHYLYCTEAHGAWDENRKDKLARLYERYVEEYRTQRDLIQQANHSS